MRFSICIAASALLLVVVIITEARSIGNHTHSSIVPTARRDAKVSKEKVLGGAPASLLARAFKLRPALVSRAVDGTGALPVNDLASTIMPLDTISAQKNTISHKMDTFVEGSPATPGYRMASTISPLDTISDREDTVSQKKDPLVEGLLNHARRMPLSKVTRMSCESDGFNGSTC